MLTYFKRMNAYLCVYTCVCCICVREIFFHFVSKGVQREVSRIFQFSSVHFQRGWQKVNFNSTCINALRISFSLFQSSTLCPKSMNSSYLMSLFLSILLPASIRVAKLCVESRFIHTSVFLCFLPWTDFLWLEHMKPIPYMGTLAWLHCLSLSVSIVFTTPFSKLILGILLFQRVINTQGCFKRNKSR